MSPKVSEAPKQAEVCCPNCRHAVKVTMRRAKAHCGRCGNEWMWKAGPRLMHLSEGK